MNKLYFATEARFIKKNGEYYSLGGFSMKLWERYLCHFSEIVVLARVMVDESVPVDDKMLVSSPNIKYIELPYYIGLSGFLSCRRTIRELISKNITDDGCIICRLPGQIGGEVISVLKRKKIPYSCEIVGSPWDVFAKGSINHPLRPIMRVVSTLALKRQVHSAQACLFVTRETLQRMYPARHNAFSIGVSDVIIEKYMIANAPKILKRKKTYKLISIGSLEQLYKSPDILIKAISILHDKGIDIELTWLGDGIYKDQMVELANRLGVKVDFKGNVPPEDVHSYLEDSDIFLLVSRTEGLPRALLEAMAHGLPCIGSKVGGIPELLDRSALVEKGNASQLAILIERYISDQEFANKQAERNLSIARQYEISYLNSNRNSYFQYIISTYERRIKTFGS